MSDYHQVYYLLYENSINIINKIFTLIPALSYKNLNILLSNILSNDYIKNILNINFNNYNILLSKLKNNDYIFMIINLYTTFTKYLYKLLNYFEILEDWNIKHKSLCDIDYYINNILNIIIFINQLVNETKKTIDIKKMKSVSASK